MIFEYENLRSFKIFLNMTLLFEHRIKHLSNLKDFSNIKFYVIRIIFNKTFILFECFKKHEQLCYLKEFSKNIYIS